MSSVRVFVLNVGEAQVTSRARPVSALTPRTVQPQTQPARARDPLGLVGERTTKGYESGCAGWLRPDCFPGGVSDPAWVGVAQMRRLVLGGLLVFLEES